MGLIISDFTGQAPFLQVQKTAGPGEGEKLNEQMKMFLKVLKKFL